MGSDPKDRVPPPWLTAASDQEAAALREVWRNNRANFESMVRRRTTSEGEVREAMAWFDAQRAHFAAAGSIHSAGPDEIFPVPPARTRQQSPAPPPPVPDRDDHPREIVHVHRTRLEVETPAAPPAPGKADRLLRAMVVVYPKSFAIGVSLAVLTWLCLTALLVWLLETEWWGLWPSVVTVPAAAVVFVAWWFTAQPDIRRWIGNGGPEPFRSRPKFR